MGFTFVSQIVLNIWAMTVIITKKSLVFKPDVAHPILRISYIGKIYVPPFTELIHETKIHFVLLLILQKKRGRGEE